MSNDNTNIRALKKQIKNLGQHKLGINPEDIFNDDNPLRAIKSGRIMARTWAKSHSVEEQAAYGQSFMVKIIETYWSRIHKDVLNRPLPFLFKKIVSKKLDKAVAAVAEAIGISAARLPIVEASYLLGNLYTAVLPDSDRAKGGVFYTPQTLTARLIMLAESAGVNWATAKVIDPACGGGAFLAPVCMKIQEALSGKKPEEVLNHIEQNLFGWEIDPFAGWLTQVFVEVVLKDLLLQTKRKLSPLVRICDSLEQPLDTIKNSYDLVIGNPPYGKTKLTESIRKRFKESLYGHPNQYGLFTHLTIQLTRNQGFFALLTPTSFLSGEYFKNLRQLIRKESHPIEIDFISFRKGVFDDVLQETMLAVYKKEKERETHKVIANQITTLENSLETNLSGTFLLPKNIYAPWILPRTPRQATIANAMANMETRLLDWGYKVSTGPLVWNRHKKQLVNNNASNCYPIVWAESVTQDGRFILRAEKKNHKPYFKFRSGDEWLVTHKPCILLQRTTAKEQEKRLIAANLPKDLLNIGVVIENHLNMIIPCVDAPLIDVQLLATFLNSHTVNEAFRTISGSVAVSAYELESMPLPKVDQVLTVHQLILAKSAPDIIEKAIMQIYTP